MQNSEQKDSAGGGQDNIGYENTEVRSDRDDKENGRLETTETGLDEGPQEKEEDNAGLRSESGKKSLGKESGNKEQG
ncbi:MAG: hypothetical protein WKF97_01200 [Chitinophagaceae bacterium]